jgi:hypothetical protein
MPLLDRRTGILQLAEVGSDFFDTQTNLVCIQTRHDNPPRIARSNPIRKVANQTPKRKSPIQSSFFSVYDGRALNPNSPTDFGEEAKVLIFNEF